MIPKRILIVDDDTALAESLRRYFVEYGFDVSLAVDGETLRTIFPKETVDLIILDLMLPGESGFDLAREIRRESDVPIIMLTGMSDEADKVVGLELGADDYVAKPFSPRELLARVNAILRRASAASRISAASALATATEKVGKFAGWRIELGRRRLINPDGEEIRLTAGEFSVLVMLVENSRRVLTREQILDCFTGGETDVFDRSVDTRVSRLRRRIESDPRNPTFLKTEWGVGYFFDTDVEWTE